MNMIVQYAQHAIVPIAEYATQYGPNSIAVSSTLITHTVNVPSGSYSKDDLRGFVNDMASANVFVAGRHFRYQPSGSDVARMETVATMITATWRTLWPEIC